MAFVFRPLVLAQDLAAICQLTAQLGYPADSNQIYQRFARIQQEPNYDCYVMQYHQKVIAYIGLIEQWSWQADQPQLLIQAFVVDAAYRAQGIGRLMLQKVEQIAAERHIQVIKLYSGNRPERMAAHQFYQNQGFIIESLGFKKIL